MPRGPAARRGSQYTCVQTLSLGNTMVVFIELLGQKVLFQPLRTAWLSLNSEAGEGRRFTQLKVSTQGQIKTIRDVLEEKNLILGFWYEEISFLVILQQSLHLFEFMLIQKQSLAKQYKIVIFFLKKVLAGMVIFRTITIQWRKP